MPQHQKHYVISLTSSLHSSKPADIKVAFKVSADWLNAPFHWAKCWLLTFALAGWRWWDSGCEFRQPTIEEESIFARGAITPSGGTDNKTQKQLCSIHSALYCKPPWRAILRLRRAASWPWWRRGKKWQAALSLGLHRAPRRVCLIFSLQRRRHKLNLGCSTKAALCESAEAWATNS